MRIPGGNATGILIIVVLLSHRYPRLTYLLVSRLPKDPCHCCTHPGRELIDTFCLRRIVELPTGETVQTAIELQEALETLYPTVNCPSEGAISRHSANHVVRTGALQIVNGILCDQSRRPLPGYGILDTIKAIIQIGMINMLEHPEKVSPTNTYDFMKLLWQFQSGLQEQDEYAKSWLDTVVATDEKNKKRRKTRQIGGVDVDDNVAIEGEYQGS